MTTITNGRNQKTIRVEHAELKTATVSIKALTVNGRQVTLALFRQLLDEPVVDPTTGAFRGLPWGTVNYCPDKKRCEHFTDIGEPHLHVVWQKDGELRRALEGAPREFTPWSRYADDWLLLALDRGWRPSEWPNGSPEWVNVRWDPTDMVVYCKLPRDRELRAGYVAMFKLRGDDYNYDHYRGREEAAKHFAALKNAASLETVHAAILQDIRAQKELHEKRCQRWRELTELDQLFIAT